jgi:hypothetical protein
LTGHHMGDGSARRLLHRLLQENGYSNDPGPVLAAAAAQHARCAEGQHAVTTARQGYVTHIGFGRRVEPGTRYCCYCKTVLGPEEEQ